MTSVAPHLTFQVRRRSRETLTRMGERVGLVLGCTFSPSDDRRFTAGEGLEATVLGLRVTLSHDPDEPEGSERTYVLMGKLHGELDAAWSEEFAPRLSITGYLHRLLTVIDGDGWYVATPAEQRAEAGLSPDDRGADAD